MDSYRPHSRAGHCFHTFHMCVDELCQRLLHSSQPPPSPGPEVLPRSFAGCGTTPPRTFPRHHRQQPLRGLLHQVQQVSKETPAYATMPTSRGKPRSGVPHATSISVSVLAAHAGVTITLKFSYGIEPSPKLSLDRP